MFQETWKSIEQEIPEKIDKAMEFIKNCTFAWENYSQYTKNFQLLIIHEVLLKINIHQIAAKVGYQLKMIIIIVYSILYCSN